MADAYVVPLSGRNLSLNVVGGKGRSLAQLVSAGFTVPRGFLVTTAAYRRFVADHALQERILELSIPAVVDRRVSFAAAAQNIGALFEMVDPAPEIAADIVSSYTTSLGNGAVAVRSSANAEDLPTMSFAGQQDTYLNVSGTQMLVDAVKKCWASLWSAEALSYRHENGIDNRSVAMGVVVQTMVEADVSGILFTANPASGERSEMIINASFGLGEAVVGGLVTPDTYVVDRHDLGLKKTDIGAKEQMIVSADGEGTQTVPVQAERSSEASLSPAALEALARTALDVEDLFGGSPQDIEWAVSDGRLWLLQSRPITNLPPDPPKDVTWPEIPGAQLLKRQVAENMPDPLSPLFEDLYLRAIFDTQSWPEGWEWRGRLTKNWMKNFVVTTVNGYAYQPIYLDSGKDWQKHMARHREEQAEVPWYVNLKRALSFSDYMVEDMKGGRLHGIYLTARFFRTFKKYPAIVTWEREQLPAYLAAIGQWEDRDPGQMTPDEILSGMLSLTEAEAQYWHALRSVIGTAKMTDGGLQTFLENNAADEGFISGTFLSGFPSRTLDAEVAMRSIADALRADPRLFELTIVTPTRRLLQALGEHDAGGEVSAAIGDYLHTYGRQVFNLDFVEPALAEAPTPFLVNLKALVRDAGYDLAARQKSVARTRRAKMRAALGYFRGKQRVEFLRAYWTARVNYPAREEALFYMGLAWSTFRSYALELGRRLVDACVLAAPDDVFYVTRADLARALEAPADSEAVADLKADAVADLKADAVADLKADAVADLKADAAAQRKLRVLRFRMEQPPAIPPVAGDKSAFATVRSNTGDDDLLHGFAVSPGSITGVASVILSPDDFDRMQPGSILVCPLTTPAWTQLFPHAAGLVTDIGSILAHGSIVAREYGIPAVLGIGNATQRIKNGQTIVVDGDRGTVSILGD